MLSILSIKVGYGQTTIFTESLGTVGGTTTIAAHEAANGFDNDSYTMTSGGAANPADIRATSVSSGYAGASGAANVFFTSTNNEYGFAIEGINTIGYMNLEISFGVRKENASGTAFATLAVEYSTDGSVWNTITVTGYPATADGTGWKLVSNISIPAGAEGQANLRLRWRKTGTIACRLDDITLVGDAAACSAPTVQASNITFSNVALYSMTINWTNGDGSSRIVKMDTTNSFTSPVDGTTYTANTVYSGAGEQIIYVGTGNTVNITGLSPNQNYYFRVYEYNCSGVASVFQIATATNNPNDQTTMALCTNPTTQASNLIFPSATTTTMNLLWTNGDGNYRIVVAKQSSAVTATPSNGTTYTASPAFGSGTAIVANEFVVYKGSGNSCTVTNLQIATTYYFTIFEYCAPTGDGSENYLTPPLTGNNNTATIMPDKCLEIESILVDGCDGGNEGRNEMVRFRVGTNPIDVNNLRVDGAGATGIINIGKWPNTSNPWQGICTSDSSTSNLAILNDSILGCGHLLEPPGGIIPAGANVILMTSVNFTPIANYFQSLGETIYVIFQCDPTYPSALGGHFKNYDPVSSLRTLVLNDITSCADTVIYDISLLTNQSGNPGGEDGGAVKYEWDGTATYFNNGCQAPFEPVGVNALNVDNLTDVCINNILNISGEVVGTYTDLFWSTNGNGTFADSTSITTTYTPDSTDIDQQIMLYLNATNACGDVKDSVVINVYSLPVAGVTANDTVICVGDLLTLTATGGTSYVWSSGDLDSVISPNPTSDITYIVTVTNHGCSSTDNINITVHPNPTVNLGANQDVCINDTIILDALVGFTYNWSDGSSNQTFNVTAQGSYSVTITDGNTCTDRDTVAFTYHNPIVDLGPDQDECQGTTIQLDAGGGYSYQWSNTLTSQSIDVNSTGFYSVTITDGNGCTDRDSINVSINANPVVNLGNDTSICAGTSLTLSGNGAVSYAWDNGVTNGVAFTPVATTTYTVTGTDASGCTNTDAVLVTVNALPTPAITGTLSYCADSNTTLVAGAYTSYNWSTTATTQTITATAGTYNVTVTDANGCTGTSA
ncbi:MAG: fibronectin type III domain-containing protein, partial [Bacteroidia bacterium]|nr:fibronectin type III domain-containing protein [Bacteroidia bacterium]